MSLFSTLNTGVSGLNASEVAIATTGNNISNANNEYYTRQRVQFESKYPSTTSSVTTGTGVSVTSIVRIHDEFVFGRLEDSSRELQYSQYMQQSLEEVAQYFPDLSDVGIKTDIVNYFNAWNDYASNPTEGSQKINLIQTAQTLATNIQDTRNSVRELQDSINGQLKTNVDELNRLGEEIAEVNKQINKIEAVEPNRANDLRDKRDEMELTLSKLVNASIFKGEMTSENLVDANLTDRGNAYNINIGGYSFVDGTSFHPIVIENTDNESAYYSLYYEQKDGVKFEVTDKLIGGKIGAMLDLRGRTIDNGDTSSGYPTDGILQGYVDDLDAFAKTLVIETNNVYSKSAQESMTSSVKEGLPNDYALTLYDESINNGSFNVIVYDSDGNEVANRVIDINDTTTMDDIKEQFDSLTNNSDDNEDNNTTNDVDDYVDATYSYNEKSDKGTFSLSVEEGYFISIDDNGTNFSGIMGMSRFFDGDSAANISVDSQIEDDPSLLQGFKSPIEGGNDVANEMVQLQYDSLTFMRSTGTESSETIEGFYRFITTNIATDAESVARNKESDEALFNTVNSEFQSISGVNIDEELTNLMKFQTSYSANAKIITTIDQMLDTLLGIKQ